MEPDRKGSSEPFYSHVQNFTLYMQRVLHHFAAQPPGLRILDVPAGAGHFGDALRQMGHTVVSADINQARPDYVCCDMQKPLPFPDQSFDAVVCLEGIEHVLNPYQLLRELIRSTKQGGQIVISTPNVTNMWSRIQFLFTGTFHQFQPALARDVADGEQSDRFHISPISYHQIRYLASYIGARVIKVDGDKIKRRVMLPLYGMILLAGKYWSRKIYGEAETPAQQARNNEIYRHINSRPALYSRSLIVVLERTTDHLPD